MKSILIPIDFSKTSHKALKVGATIAKRINAKINLIHMAGLEEGLNDKNNSFEQAIYYSKVIGQKFEELIKEPYLEGIIVEPLLKKHLDFKEISDLALEMKAVLIVMGSNGSKGLTEIIKGSNTEKVVRHSETPVLVVKDNEINFAPERILFVSDFNVETVKAYHRMIEVATMLNARIEFLYVNLPGDQFKSTGEMDEILLEFFRKVKHPDVVNAIKTVNRYADYSVEQGAMNFASLAAADIIAIPTHGRTGISHLLKGSISEDIANHAVMPVLTVKM
ncbi:nucleotide-binding universal stress UspA family protein [Nonlabens dokdonensis]|jgi:nucleotide-binding universal stress UspA family protein|uniref:Nucleotide-binding universal stress UspA family protein n=2 Tax=Nonlabens dokdonensis TaxID=328515 RepID=A0ABX5Q085_9FLAO|nr:universal stress protein [Nonlabens dokdonensis]AGC75788.1 putative universal stress protein [Nonlabens dokdonensis DSW-6]PZX43470.1 nucleotide-binding universal stress UspA family protein [Nonlabens dokdonensis]